MLIVKMGTREEDLKMKKTRRKKILIIKMETRERRKFEDKANEEKKRC